jgi:hypothetical protein
LAAYAVMLCPYDKSNRLCRLMAFGELLLRISCCTTADGTCGARSLDVDAPNGLE